MNNWAQLRGLNFILAMNSEPPATHYPTRQVVQSYSSMSAHRLQVHHLLIYRIHPTNSKVIEENTDSYYKVTKKGSGLKIIENAMIKYSKLYLD